MQKRNKLAIFLGSGASSSFGKPVTRALREQLHKKYGISHENYLSAMLGCNKLEDFEHLITAAYEIQDLLYNSYAGSFLTYLGSDTLRVMRAGNWTPFNTTLGDWQTVVKSLEDEVYANYRWDHSKTKLARDTYIKLLDFLAQYFNDMFIATTNYDKAIEYSLGQAGDYDSIYRCVDGFEEVSGTFRWMDQFYHPKPVSGKTDIVLCKLHGSLDWKRRNDNAVFRTGEESRSLDPNYKQNVLIYPTLTPKHQHNDRQLTGILKEFQSQLADSNVLVTIGFSFRDKYLSEYFLNFQKSGKPIIVISPESWENVTMNLVPGGKFDASSKNDLQKVIGHEIYCARQLFQLENIEKINSLILQCIDGIENK